MSKNKIILFYFEQKSRSLDGRFANISSHNSRVYNSIWNQIEIPENKQILPGPQLSNNPEYLKLSLCSSVKRYLMSCTGLSNLYTKCLTFTKYLIFIKYFLLTNYLIFTKYLMFTKCLICTKYLIFTQYLILTNYLISNKNSFVGIPYCQKVKGWSPRKSQPTGRPFSSSPNM